MRPVITGTLASLMINIAFAATGPSDAEIARFLNHASFGATEEAIAHVKSIGYEAYLDEQFAMPLPDYFPYQDVSSTTPDNSICNSTCQRDFYSTYPLQLNFFKNALTGQDQLRQRVAFALSQILVVSAQVYDIRHPSRFQPYLKLLDKHAFGNYRQLLEEITLNPAMGVYLDMAGNRKTAPNENYAREILQLFSIGLYELNQDGTLKKSKAGPIPSYDQTVIGNFSRVFTGWSLAPSTKDPTWKSYSTPMMMTDANHDVGEKILLGGKVLPAGLAMADELDAALDNIFANSNVSPFISRQLIQHLVSSNPTPAYVGRVAKIFKASAGDMKAVVRAILLDKEALKPPSKTGGHLRSPVLWLTHLLRAFKVHDATNDASTPLATAPTTNTDFVLSDLYLPSQFDMLQDVYRAPSVFNYFPPDYAVPNTKLQGPEFGIFSTTEAFKRVNFAYALIYHKVTTSTDRPKGTWIDSSSLLPLAADPNALLAKLSSLMMPEGMSANMQKSLLALIYSAPVNERLLNAIYWIATSPEFQIEK
jgi:hypothetical protein